MTPKPKMTTHELQTEVSEYRKTLYQTLLTLLQQAAQIRTVLGDDEATVSQILKELDE